MCLNIGLLKLDRTLSPLKFQSGKYAICKEQVAH